MRMSLAFAVSAVAFLSIGCVLREGPRVEREEVREEVVGDPVEAEPPPAQRVYVYERGYPPGTYFYDGYYYYGRQRYERNVFITKVVNVNIQKNKYVNVTENRRVGQQIEQQHRQTHPGTNPPPPPPHKKQKKSNEQ